ncbi:MAG: glycosyltransferase family 2 protein [Paracoccaceae bacterium]
MALRRTLVSTLKDEGPFILEWLAYHKVIGFNHFVIFSNDSTDGTTGILDCLHEAGEIMHIENSAFTENEPADPQTRAYKRAKMRKDVKQSEWVLVADGDEFLNIHAGNGSLDDLFAAMGNTDVISATWRIHGNSGVEKFTDGLVIDQFRKAADLAENTTQRYWGFKTLFRPAGVRKFGVHRPKFAPRFLDDPSSITWRNGSGEVISEHVLKQGWRSQPETVGYDLVQMNHYMIKSSESFLMKRLRGTANSADQNRIDFGYFQMFNANTVVDGSITRHIAAVQTEIKRMKLAAPGLDILHNAAVSEHQARISTARSEIAKTMPETAQSIGITLTEVEKING